MEFTFFRKRDVEPSCFSNMDVSFDETKIQAPIKIISTAYPEESEEAVKKHKEGIIAHLSKTLNDGCRQPF